MGIAMLVLTVIGVTAAIVAALPPLGFDLRIVGRPKMPLEGIPYFRARQAGIAIVIAFVSLGVSVAAFYYFFRPRLNIVNGGTSKTSPESGLNYIWVPPGTFSMGCLQEQDKWCEKHPEETPQHNVTITKGFWIGETEVTVFAYKRLHSAMPPAPSFNPNWGEEEQPIVNVTWDQAGTFCATDQGHLPTEAQWEFAARGKSTVPRYGDPDKIMWYQENSRGRGARAVKQHSPNYLGLYDTLGNVWEWVRDWYDPKYYSMNPTPPDPIQETRGGQENERGSHVLRGGSWKNTEEFVRLTNRNREQDVQNDAIGFRCVQD
ncbi:MAG: hypothetical protein JWQ87_2950 [Candidatus Sulfotelmatobacter sp.]|nr:hypothetical protein [Candidatus Sulfotelmatobacter sp.]